ncbi:MAG: hypothetical protein AMXMBFR56_34050 [Polyangiaceae bacterium]
MSRRELGRVGRARRFEAGSAELWRLGSEERALAERLAELGRRGIGGFVAMGEDADGIWVERRVPRETLAEFLRAEHEPSSVVERLLALARVLEALEEASLFPGPLSPKGVVVVGDRVELLADPLIHALVGEPALPDRAADSASPRFMPPEQADGAAWDNAANRYVLGLMLYRGLALEHAFAVRGLRHGLEEAAHRAPPPIADARAALLPPGLQSFCLRLLDPDPRERPKSAAEIARGLSRFLAGEAPKTARSPDPRAPEPPRAAEPTTEGARPAKPVSSWRLGALLPVLAGLALAAVAFAALDERPGTEKRALAREPLRPSETLASDCAACHPRQTGEWHRSVMAHAAKSPLYQALEILIEEQVGRDLDCPNGAGILRSAGAGACRDRVSGLPVTGSGGELWCVNCHAPAENLEKSLPAWDGRGSDARSRLPLADLLSERAMEGISCGFCHQVRGPVRPARGGYQGNPFWTSTRTGERFSMRPEDARGAFGISNSGYELDPAELFAAAAAPEDRVPGGAHARPTKAAAAFLQDSRFCGTCHDVRLFGSDVIGARKGEHFKRLRNAFSEWQDYVAAEARAGRKAASCQDCHMSTFPGVCETERGAPGGSGCPPGTRLVKRAPGSYPDGRWASSSGEPRRSTPHYFSGVDLPLSAEFADGLVSEPTVDVFGIPLGAAQRRQILLQASVSLKLEGPALRGATLELPVVFENVGGGHRVPAGFSQEREVWLHLRVSDARGRRVYEVGRVERDDEDLRDKVFLRVNTDDGLRDGQGRPLGMFGADVADGPDVPRFSPNPARGGQRFRGRGLVNFQNGFLRCVVCIGSVDASGRCQPLPGQERARADRYADGTYDPDTGECQSNLLGDEALFETYFPIGALDATRGATRGPDAIIDTRSLPPRVPITYVYEIPTSGFTPPFEIETRLLFRAFPPFLLRAFIDYERRQARLGKRPSGPAIDQSALARNTIVEMARVSTVVR